MSRFIYIRRLTAFFMKYVVIIAGAILVVSALIYFVRLLTYLLESYEFTEFGFGILAGRVVMLVIGALLIRWGIRMKQAKSVSQ